MKFFAILFSLCMLSSSAFADNLITVEQIGSYNTIQVSQDGTGHTTDIKLGADSNVDNSYITITQQGTGTKNASIEIRSGINNTVTIGQDGAGNHTASLQNINGSANGITVNQTGTSSHTFNVIGQTGTTNSGNTINATQSGSGSKNFDLTLGGSSGASVTIEQTNSLQSDSGSMLIQCVTCGSYSYIRQ